MVAEATLCHSRKRSGIRKKLKENPHVKGKDGGFLGGAVVENLPANAGDTGSSTGLGRSHMLQSN